MLNQITDVLGNELSKPLSMRVEEIEVWLVKGLAPAFRDLGRFFSHLLQIKH